MNKIILLAVFLMSYVAFAEEQTESLKNSVLDNVVSIPDFLKADLEETSDDAETTPKEKHQYTAESNELPVLDTRELQEQHVAGAKYQQQQELFIAPDSQYRKKDEDIKEIAPEEPSSEQPSNH